MSFQRLAWLLALTGFEFTTQKQGYFGVKSKHSPFIDTLIVSQGTVPSLIPCKNLSVRRLLWLRRRYLLSTITVCRLPFKTAPTSWTVTRTCDRVINDIKYSLRFEIQPIQKKQGYCLWRWCQLFSYFTFRWGHSRMCNASLLDHSESWFKFNLFFIKRFIN